MFGFSGIHQNTFLFLNRILLLFNHFIYVSTGSNILLFSRFFRHLKKVYTIEQKRSRELEKKETALQKVVKNSEPSIAF